MDLADHRIAAAAAEGPRTFGRRLAVLPQLRELLYSGTGPHDLLLSKGRLLFLQLHKKNTAVKTAGRFALTKVKEPLTKEMELPVT
jgi:hypothetical protein